MPKKTAQKWAVPTKEEELKCSVGDEETSMPKSDWPSQAQVREPEESPSSLSLKNLSWQHCLLHPGSGLAAELPQWLLTHSHTTGSGRQRWRLGRATPHLTEGQTDTWRGQETHLTSMLQKSFTELLFFKLLRILNVREEYFFFLMLWWVIS